MKENGALRIGVQLIGLYYLCGGASHFLRAVVDYFYQRFPRYSISMPPNPSFAFVLRDLLEALVYIVVAWVLLAKTDWTVSLINRLSAPPTSDDSTEARPDGESPE